MQKFLILFAVLLATTLDCSSRHTGGRHIDASFGVTVRATWQESSIGCRIVAPREFARISFTIEDVNEAKQIDPDWDEEWYLVLPAGFRSALKKVDFLQSGRWSGAISVPQIPCSRVSWRSTGKRWRVFREVAGEPWSFSTVFQHEFLENAPVTCRGIIVPWSTPGTDVEPRWEFRCWVDFPVMLYDVKLAPVLGIPASDQYKKGEFPLENWTIPGSVPLFPFWVNESDLVDFHIVLWFKTHANQVSDYICEISLAQAGGIDIAEVNEQAQPGATDNPDGAQRLREDH